MLGSAFAWYQNIRDRGLAQALKDYTCASESSFLLHQELEFVQASPQ